MSKDRTAAKRVAGNYALNNNCPDCNVEAGETHLEGCDVERCPECGGQLISCGCDTDSELLPWTGEWPGKAECREFGWYCRWERNSWVRCGKDEHGASEDLNRLAIEAKWDKEQRRYVHP